MSAENKRDVESALGDTVKSLGTQKDSFLSEAGLARAIESTKNLASEDAVMKYQGLENGHQLGDFVIESKIQQGGMGVIYSATQQPLGRRVALKTIIPSKVSEFSRERFRRERKLLGELHESNVVPVFAAGVEGEVEYFAMPYIKGQSIKEIVHEGESHVFSNIVIAQIIIDLADGVDAIHQQGIIHRDITPNNVILDDSARAWLIDFGIATKVDSKPSETSRDFSVFELSTDGRLGTPRYKAPELEQGVSGTPTDVFGLGVCLYCLVTNSDFSIERYREAGLSATPSTPQPLKSICLKALDDEPEKRYKSAAELASDLRRWLRDEPVNASTYSSMQRAWLWLKRNPIKSVSTASAFLILAIASIAAVTNADSRAQAASAQLNSKLSRMESLLLAGDFDEAEEVVAADQQFLRITAEKNQKLFLQLASLIWRTNGIESAMTVIDKARKTTDDGPLLAELKLLEADLFYAVDFQKSEQLVNEALESSLLSDNGMLYARALLSPNAIEEGKLIRAVIDNNPFHLRAQQLLVMNLIFLGKESEARQQLASARVLFPRDPSLMIAEGFVAKLFTATEVYERAGKLEVVFPEIGGHIDYHGFVEPNPIEPVEPIDWRQFDDADPEINRILELMPRPELIKAPDINTAMREVDRFLQLLVSLQNQMAETGYVLLPPSLFRALSDFKRISRLPSDPDYWPALEPELRKVATANPDMLFRFALARSLYAQHKRDASKWLEAQKILEESLLIKSVFPIRPIVIQQLALVSIDNYIFHTQKSESAKKRMVRALKLLISEGRMPSCKQTRQWINLVEGCLHAKEWELAGNFCKQWRQALEDENGSKDDVAHAMAYSAVAARARRNYVNALSWIDEAIEMAPDHPQIQDMKNVRSGIIREFETEVKTLERRK